jgi:hypothetical protein
VPALQLRQVPEQTLARPPRATGQILVDDSSVSDLEQPSSLRPL